MKPIKQDNREIKILNLYAGIGGNRKLWTNCKVTAIELDENIAKIYKDFFPNDEVIVADAHQYLLDHYKEYDFIWSSPPCPTHSQLGRLRAFNEHNKATGQYSPPKYPDMKLYEEILFLQGYFKGKYCVENVIAWYKPLIEPQKIGRHWYWSNFDIPQIKTSVNNIAKGKILDWEKQYGFNLNGKVGIEKRRVLRNCVEPEVGLHILNQLSL